MPTNPSAPPHNLRPSRPQTRGSCTDRRGSPARDSSVFAEASSRAARVRGPWGQRVLWPTCCRRSHQQVWVPTLSPKRRDPIVMPPWDEQLRLQSLGMQTAVSLEPGAELAPALQRRGPRLCQGRKGAMGHSLGACTPDCYRSVSHRFGVGTPPVGAVASQVCKAIEPLQLLSTVPLGLGDPQKPIDGFKAMGFSQPLVGNECPSPWAAGGWLHGSLRGGCSMGALGSH